ncbi:zinc finger BED domain-containing protein RICESLEEPER 3-like [Oryza brachyantha]|uniref:zinc finger BED domain-containing protein RICESLEEPER 3-like n=1 Tax=Oryza brachyantha TaxID=4533 RepID=UPI001ADA3CD0|nr:zinc finger BED domain-containing protein RICESLEEPER 3-like [Oryza brachyantha]
MVHGSEIVGNEMIHGNEMVVHDSVMIHGNEMAQENGFHGSAEMVQRSNMIHGNEIIRVNQPVNEAINGDKMAHGNELVVVEAAIPPTASRRRRKKSVVWEHFTIEEMPGGDSRASCNLCKQSFAYSSGSKISGTSHLKRHISLASCPVLKYEDRKLALPLATVTDNDGEGAAAAERPAKRRYRSTTGTFDQDRTCSNLAKMVILHGYPLHIAEQRGFTALIGSLQPRFRVVGVDTIEGQVHAVYQKEKKNLMQVFSTMPGRVSLTVGLWTTTQTLGYVSLAAQFIDTEWRVRRTMVNFTMVSSPHSENALSEAISTSLSDWNMKDRLFTITLDNDHSSHDIYSANLVDSLSKKGNLIIKGQLFVVRCYAHTLNAVAQDVVASIQGVIYHIRESIKFIKSDSVHEEKFAEIALLLEIPSAKTLCLDVTTQWNTTYLMLLAALDYQQVFKALETCDVNYNEAPSAEDWKKVEAACGYLNLLYDSAHNIMAAPNPTSNIFFHEAWKLQSELCNAIAHEDPTLRSIAKIMHERHDKYWKDCNLVLAIAVVMDPRFKMKLVEFSYSKIHGVEAAKHVKAVDDAVHDVYSEYAVQGEEADRDTHVSCRNTAAVSTPPNGDELLDFDVYLSEISVSRPSKSELDQYLEEALLPRVQELDVLEWWRLNTLKFPTLSKMARDVLAIPVSMASGGGSSIFSAAATGSRMLDDYRSSLRPETVEALFCAKDWLR